jgi:hypothetical protein
MSGGGALRPLGLLLLLRLVGLFRGEEDAEFKGHALLEQFQAQLLLALSTAFQDIAEPQQVKPTQ